MAVPKRKVSKARRDKRRSSVWKLDLPGMTKCPKCGEYTLSHRVCTRFRRDVSSSGCASWILVGHVKNEEKSNCES